MHDDFSRSQICSLLLCAFLASFVPAEEIEPPVSAEAQQSEIRFDYQERPDRPKIKPVSIRYRLQPGETVLLSITMEFLDGWQTFSATHMAEAAEPTEIELEKFFGLEPLVENFVAVPKPVLETPIPDLEWHVHRGSVTWTRKLIVSPSASPGHYGVAGSVSYSVCKNNCTRVRTEFHVGDVDAKESVIRPAVGDASSIAPVNRSTSKSVAPASIIFARQYNSLLDFIGTAITWGGLTVLIPGMWVAVPMVVGLFARLNQSPNYRPLIPLMVFQSTTIATLTTCVLLRAILRATSANSVENSFAALAVVVVAIAVFDMLGFLPWPETSSLAACLRAAVAGLTVSLTILPFTFLNASLIAIAGARGSFLWCLLGSIAFTSTISAPFFFIGLFPTVLKAF
ncbi:MAG TPA: hypothetical protein VGM98_19450, partial [Schlesneria sp.]